MVLRVNYGTDRNICDIDSEMMSHWLIDRVIQILHGFYVQALLIEEVYSSFKIAVYTKGSGRVNWNVCLMRCSAVLLCSVRLF